jgi:hypothetical protein
MSELARAFEENTILNAKKYNFENGKAVSTN